MPSKRKAKRPDFLSAEAEGRIGSLIDQWMQEYVDLVDSGVPVEQALILVGASSRRSVEEELQKRGLGPDFKHN